MDCDSGRTIKGASEGNGELPFLLISSEMFPHLACDNIAASRVERQDCMGTHLWRSQGTDLRRTQKLDQGHVLMSRM